MLDECENVIVSFSRRDDGYDMYCECTVIEGLGVIDSMVEYLSQHTGISREEILENFKEPKGDNNGK